MKEKAKELIKHLYEIYSERHEYQIVNANDFRHLDLEYYNKVATLLEKDGFVRLGDIEDITVTRASPYLHRVFIRALVSRDGKIASAIFDAKPKGLISILSWLLGNRREKVTEFETEFSNGCFILTTHAQASQQIALPLEIIPQYLPKKTAPLELLTYHQTRVEAYLKQYPDVQPIVIRSLEELLESQHRAEALKSAHRQAQGGAVTLKEIKDIAKEGNISSHTATKLFTEMQKIQEPDKPHDISWDMQPSLPENWDDHEDWEKHYASLSSSSFLEKHEEELLAPFSEIWEIYEQMLTLMESNEKNLWFPGCGFSYLPKLFAECGFRVHATDISKTAIQYQQNLNVAHLKAQIDTLHQNNIDEETPPLKRGLFEYALHDFRTPYQESYFDAIFNVHAIEGFSRQTMTEAATVHCAALRPGRYAYFFTNNLLDEKRNELEKVLGESGFFMPGFEIKKWFHDSLEETGITHIIFMGGHPIIERVGEYQENENKWYKDMDQLDNIFQEYRAKSQSAYEEIPFGRKVAVVIQPPE
jgi:uncharacterized protein YozE (UPF0346 family)